MMQLGMFQYVILSIINKFPDKATAVDIAEIVMDRFKKESPSAQISMALGRMQTSGYIKFEGLVSLKGKGQPRKKYSLTSDGLSVLLSTRRVFEETERWKDER
jgi:DNA-binding PadR family transcriptional regulator